MKRAFVENSYIRSKVPRVHSPPPPLHEQLMEEADYLEDEHSLEVESNAESDEEASEVEMQPRDYQSELFDCAVRRNTIVYLNTGSGKTYVAVMLMQHYGAILNATENRKWGIMLVPTTELVVQQGAVLRTRTGYGSDGVGLYRGVDGVDYWQKERWCQEIDRHQVLVMTPAIFLDLLTHGYMHMRDVAVLVLDECHHAVGNHPYASIMRTHYAHNYGSEPRPRVLGLTASIFSGKVKDSMLTKEMYKLEKTLMSTVATSVLETAQAVGTRPDIQYYRYRNSQEPESLSCRMKSIITEAAESLRSIAEGDKEVDRLVRYTNEVLQQLGPWACIQCAKEVMSDIQKHRGQLEPEEPTQERLQVVQDMVEALCVQHTPDLTVHNHEELLTQKAVELLQVLLDAKTRFQTSCTELRCLVFVKTRQLAAVLCGVLKSSCALLGADFGFIRAEYVTGYSSLSQTAGVTAAKQRSIIEDFRCGKINILVCTSVLAEGVDVPECNVVLRFDPPNNFCDYIQSKGRARARPSLYGVFMPCEGLDADRVVKDFGDFAKIEQAMPQLLQSSCIDREDETWVFDGLPGQEEPVFAPQGPDGSRITPTGSISLLERYCSTQSRGLLGGLRPIWTLVDGEESGPFRYRVRLPPTSLVRDIVESPQKSNKRSAKNYAAFEMIKILYARGELNHRLLPHRPEQEEDEDNSERKAGVPVRGTQKYRLAYPKHIPVALRDLGPSPKGPCWLYHVHLTGLEEALHVPPRSQLKRGWALLVSKRLPSTPAFTVFHDNSAIVVRLSASLELRLDAVELDKLRVVHETLVQQVWRLSTMWNDVHRMKPDDSPKSGPLFVPFLYESRIYEGDPREQLCGIDWNTVDSINRSPKATSQVFVFNEDDYSGAVIRPVHKDPPEYYMVAEVETATNPKDPFPENKKFSSYADYYLKTYNCKISDFKQPLLRCTRRVPSIKQRLTPSGKMAPHKARDFRFIPELCEIQPLPAELWLEAACLPTVYARLLQIHTADELRRQITSNIYVEPLPVEVILAQRDEQHLFQAVLEHQARCAKTKQEQRSTTQQWLGQIRAAKNVPWREASSSHGPGLDRIMEALTHRSAADLFDLERLETVGDSLLKYVVSVHVFCSDPNLDEGRLTRRRARVISNKNLLRCASARQLEARLSNTALDLSNKQLNWLPPGFQALGPEAPADGTATQRDLRLDQQLIGDKRISDCVEALIGCFLLHGSEEQALRFLHWLGLNLVGQPGGRVDVVHVPKKPSWPTAPGSLQLYSVEQRAQPRKTCQQLYQKYKLHSVERAIGYEFGDQAYLVEAFTHGSAIDNTATSSYERLEFLGDAVIDYIITRLLYECPKKFDPGELTDLRSALVNNYTLARLSVGLGLQKHLIASGSRLQQLVWRYSELLDGSETPVEEMSGADDVCKVLGDLFESMVGAVFLDCGQSLPTVWNVIRPLFCDKLDRFVFDVPKDPVRRLFEAYPEAKISKPKEEADGQIVVRLELLGQQFVGRGRNRTAARRKLANVALTTLRHRPAFN